MSPIPSRASTRRNLRQLAVSGPRRAALELTADVRAVRTVRRSGLFDEAWYRSQLAETPAPGDDLVRHYVRIGAAQDLSPHPLFHPAWYQATVKGAGRSAVGPFVHFLRRGVPRGDPPHPLVDAKAYVAAHPQAREHRAGIVGHYLEHWQEPGVQLNDWFDPKRHRALVRDADPSQPAILDFARRTASRLATVRPGGPRAPERSVTPAAERAFAEEMHASWSEPSDPGGPLVSVVLPVRDRADLVGAAIASALDQTLEAIEVIVVDDGSVDGTAEVVRGIPDARVRLVEQARTGPYAARNRGLREATGTHVAYLDADVRWRPDHLELAVAVMESRGQEAVFGAVVTVTPDATRVTGQALDQPQLLPDDDADVTTLVHRRELLDRFGTWDEGLYRSGSLDYVLRLSRVVRLHPLPMVSSERDGLDVRRDRISVGEPAGERDVVIAKHRYDWTAGGRGGPLPASEVDALVSVVVVLGDRVDDLAACVKGVLATVAAEQSLEVIVVDRGRDLREGYQLLQFESANDVVRVVRVEDPACGLAVAVNDGIQDARGSIVVLLHPGVRVQPGWLEPLLAPLREGRVAATQPKVIGRGGTVASTGYVIGPDLLPVDALAGWAEHAPEVEASADRVAVSRACLAVRRDDLVAVRGVDPRFGAQFLDVDLCLRLRSPSRRPSRYVHESTVLWLRPEPAADEARLEADRRHYEERWSRTRVADTDDAIPPGFRVTHRVYVPVLGDEVKLPTLAPESYRAIVERVDDRERPLRFAIKVGAHDVLVRRRWGDWHFAISLRDALQRCGHEAVVDLKHGWYRSTAHLDDAVVVLRGRHGYRPNPDQVNLLWLISHPDLVSDAEAARYDETLVASLSFARKLQASTGRRVEAMLQCTDASRFVPGPQTEPEHELLFVGNSRGQMRPVVRHALDAGLPLTLYGAHWETLVPRKVVAGTYVPNESLGVTYRSAGVVLNDHWEDMRREGFVSNRLFDLAACGANVVSDPVEGLHEIFGTTFRTYEEAEQLPVVVHEALAHREAERGLREELAERTRREHSFDARAERIADLTMAQLARRRSESSRRDEPATIVDERP